MAGAGYKLFNTGDVLSASDVNTYLMQQTVMSFASSAARTTALASVLAEGMVTYLQDTNVVEIYTGAAWVSLDDPNAIQNSIVDAKGDLISATADNTPARLAVGTNNQVLTADSSTATGLKWATPAASTATFSGCEIRKTVAQSVASASYTTVTWDTETFDTDAFHSNTTNNSRITIPTGKGGYYLIYWNIGLSGSAVAISLDKNGGVYKRSGGYSTGGGVGYYANTEIMSLAAGDYIEVAVYTTSSGLVVESDAQNTKLSTFGISFIGA
jgi:hypothetical protein